MTELNRQLPNSREIERAILAAILIDSSVFVRIPLQPGHFDNGPNRIVFAAMVEMAKNGDSIDMLQLKDRLRLAGHLDAVGGSAYISGLLDTTPNMVNIEKYASTIIEKATLRRIITTCNNAMRRSMDEEPAVDIIAELQTTLSTLTTGEDRGTRGMYDVVTSVASERDERGEASGVLTGYDSIDLATNGLPRRALTVLAAPSSHGKTAFALNLVMKAVEHRSSTRAAYYSLEMSREAVTDRILSRMSGLFLGKLRQWSLLSDTDRMRADTAIDELYPLNQRFSFTDSLSSISEIIADCRRRHAEHGLDLVVVDYLQLVAGLDEDNRERTVNLLAWQLFEMAKTLNLAVVALSQVTPAAKFRPDLRLSIDDLRDSKAIGHHARIVFMLNRVGQANKKDPACQTVLQIEKNSEGMTGDFAFHFDAPIQSFTEGQCDPTRCWWWKSKPRTV